MDIKNLYKAIADFQQEVPVILKDTSGHNYKYADLPAILEVINPLLKKHKLGFVQPLTGAQLKTIIFHTETGEAMESAVDLPFDSLTYEPTIDGKKYVLRGFEAMNKAQAIGSLITYFRRYSLSSLLGLVTDKDTDGTGKTVDLSDPF